ncbi:MAG: flagellar biosynthesis protein FlhA [Treponemataceae bacterium]|nr:MAG: flagellar biosynthesis protein FlhA [Treponemataceae bacterium]
MAETSLQKSSPLSIMGAISSNFVAVAVIVIVMMLIIPLPTVLLDVFMTMNLVLAVLVLLTAIYTQRVLDFSSFPSVLLISTLFGLALNVSSTRLILTQGAAFDGRMIKAFSSFVVGAKGAEGLGVGLVMFIILIAVQAFVITKGATRVAEVAARFTLDAMPMKQAAVEAEYSSGAITEEEARKRKLEVQQEADFYGAMDGSSKFVSGNVKIGIFITFVNVIAGIIFGMVLRGEQIGNALVTYTTLTIGDGLLSQLPSLMISVSTGIIVTRSASKEPLSTDIRKQFSQNAWIYFIGGATLILIGVLPGFPWYVLLPMGVGLLFVGRNLSRIKALEFSAAVSAEKAKQKSAPAESDAASIAPLDALSLELGFGLIPLVDKEKGAELLERVTRIRKEAGLDLGLIVPKIRIIDNMRLEPNEYSFKIKGVEAGRAKIRMGWYMCMDTGNVREPVEGEKTVDPTFGMSAVWVSEEDRPKAELAGYAVVDSPTIIATHLTELIKSNAADILGRQEVQLLIDSVKKDSPAVIEEVLKNMGVGDIQKVFRGLLRERVSIRNRVVILETIADFAPITKKTDILVEKVRQALGRQICLQYVDEKHVMHVMTVEPQFLETLVGSAADTVNGPLPALEPVTQRAWIQAVSSALAECSERGMVPVILCPEQARLLVKLSTEREMPALVVISIPEVPGDIKVESIGEIHVG